MAKLLVIAGSTRTGAFSKQLARAACRIAEAAGHQATFVDLRDHPMPLYDGDLEEAKGLPEHAVRLRGIVTQHDAVLVVTPEYNSSISAVLKNTLDWLSRPYKAEPGVSPWKQKVTAIMASSPGALGGLRGLVHLRQILMNLGAMVITEQFALGGAATAFTPDGALADGKQAAAVKNVLERLAHVASRLA
ncbi:MAG: NAD(P)H-dependent oxidoreductase [Planctomycetota bacterium]